MNWRGERGISYGAATTLVVLSRADELGGARLGSLVSARDAARAYAEEPLLRAHSVGVVPVAGLLAYGARMLRQDDFSLLSALTTVSRDDREAMLVSVDRYCTHGVGGTAAQRQALVRRVGLFGIRMGMALISQGFETPSSLAAELERQSGLAAVEAVLADHFLPRSRVLIARNLVNSLEALAEQCPEPAANDLRIACDRFRAQAGHGLVELVSLLRLRVQAIAGLTEEQRDEAACILGEQGATAWQRLGISSDASAAEFDTRRRELATRWRTLAQDPETLRTSRQLARQVLATLDRIAVRTGMAGQPAAT